MLFSPVNYEDFVALFGFVREERGVLATGRFLNVSSLHLLGSVGNTTICIFVWLPYYIIYKK